MSRTEETAQFWQLLAERPYAFDLFATLRRIESLHPERPRLGRSRRPSQDPVRLGQAPSTAFAPATLADVDNGQALTKLRILSFGLFGPNGPLPLGMTEYAMERANHHGDDTLAAFADIFHHRLIQLFYRAWSSAQSTVSLDRENDDFTRYVASLVHHGLPGQRQRDSVHDHARWSHAGHLSRQVRNTESLERILGNYFGIAVRLEEFTPHWLPLPRDQRTQLHRHSMAQLGVNTVAGKAVLDKQHSFRLRLGPMSLENYRHFLPEGRNYPQLLDWLYSYIGIEFAWDVRLVLRATDVPSTRLGAAGQLGQTTWLGNGGAAGDRDDLLLNPPRRAARHAPHPTTSTRPQP